MAAVFIDPKNLSRNTTQSIEDTYHQLLRQFRLFPASYLKGIEGKVKACDASSRYAENPIESDFIRIGDANLSVDPLSSQGVQLAVASGLQAAIVVNTLIKYSENTELAIAFYCTRQQEKIKQYVSKTVRFYQQVAAVRNQSFWHQRATAAKRSEATIFEEKRLDSKYKIKLSDSANMNLTPIIKEDMIVSMPALHHDTLDRPVAFIGGVEIVPLLRQIRSGQTIQEVLETWSKTLPTELGFEIMTWLWFRKIIVPISGG